MKTWTKAEIDILKENYNKVSNVELRKLLPDKSALAIYKKGYKMGFSKTKEIETLNRSIAHKGEKSKFWKGGTAITSKGYKLIKMPEHHRADKKGYVLEHILVFEKETGLQVPNDCCVHHLNGIKSDNRIENLCLMSHSAHTKLHHCGAKRTKETRQKISESRKIND